MRFVDEAIITAAGGQGGDGAISFLRNRRTAKGGPDGGDGGDGGEVMLYGDERLHSLYDFLHHGIFQAAAGQAGGKTKKSGKKGAPLMLSVPLGTNIYAAETGEPLGELATHGATLLVAKGGRGGYGNTHFRSSIRQTPRFGIPGTAGEQRHLILSLQLPADVALIGPNNAGKSQLLNAISNATPTIADYPFTTVEPTLGMVDMEQGKRFSVVEIPGLILDPSPQQHQKNFLSHLGRVDLTLIVLDASEDQQHLVNTLKLLQQHLQQLDKTILTGTQSTMTTWLVLNKWDLYSDVSQPSLAEKLIETLGWQLPVFTISAKNQQGTQELCNQIMAYLEQHNEQLLAAPHLRAAKQKRQQAFCRPSLEALQVKLFNTVMLVQ